MNIENEFKIISVPLPDGTRGMVAIHPETQPNRFNPKVKRFEPIIYTSTSWIIFLY